MGLKSLTNFDDSLSYSPVLCENEGRYRIYRRHTNFSMESIEQTFNGSGDFGKKVTCTVSRNGDLIHRVYLRVEVPSVSVGQNKAFRWLNWLGHILIKNVEIEIGGQRINNVSAEKYQVPIQACAA